MTSMANLKRVRGVLEPVLVQDHHGWRARGFPTKQPHTGIKLTTPFT